VAHSGSLELVWKLYLSQGNMENRLRWQARGTRSCRGLLTSPNLTPISPNTTITQSASFILFKLLTTACSTTVRSQDLCQQPFNQVVHGSIQPNPRDLLCAGPSSTSLSCRQQWKQCVKTALPYEQSRTGKATGLCWQALSDFGTAHVFHCIALPVYECVD
jgi:hypothetical protein